MNRVERSVPVMQQKRSDQPELEGLLVRHLMFTVGSLGVAISAVLLFVAIIVTIFLGRALSSSELIFAVIGSSVAGFFWWRAMRSKLQQRRSAADK